MQTVALVILLLLAFGLIGVVLLQRNEGGGLGMGAGGVMSGRGQATALARATWILGAAFMAMSLILTVLAARDAGDASVVDRVNPGAADTAPVTDPSLPADLQGNDLLPPTTSGGATETTGGTTPTPAPAQPSAPLVPSGD